MRELSRGILQIGEFAMSALKLSEDMCNSSMGVTDYKVFHYMFARLRYDNTFGFRQFLCARDLKLAKQQVNRSVKKLMEIGIILSDKNDEGLVYSISPKYGHRGSYEKGKTKASEKANQLWNR